MRGIARIKGRSDDTLIIRGVNVFLSQIQEALRQNPIELNHRAACSGSYLARARGPPPGNTVIRRGWSRLMDIMLGVGHVQPKFGQLKAGHPRLVLMLRSGRFGEHDGYVGAGAVGERDALRGAYASAD